MNCSFPMLCLGLAALVDSMAGADCNLTAVSTAIDRGNLAAAEAGLRALETSRQPCDEALLQTGRLRLAQGNLPAAEDLFFRYINAAPKDARGYYQIAALSFAKGDYQRADTFSTTALTYNPDYAEALVIQGSLLGLKGESGGAQTMLERACKLKPGDPLAHFELGMIYDRLKSYPEAVAAFERVIALNPRHAQAWDYLGLNLEPLGQIEKADAAFRRALEVNQGRWADNFLDYNYGRFLFKQNRLEQSRLHLDRALERAPGVRAVHYEHAKLSLRMRNLAVARRDAEKALAIPDRSGVIIDLQIYYLLQQIYTQGGETALAQKYAELSRTTAVPKRR